MDTDQTQPPKPKMFERRKKPKTMGAHGTHTASSVTSHRRDLNSPFTSQYLMLLHKCGEAAPTL